MQHSVNRNEKLLKIQPLCESQALWSNKTHCRHGSTYHCDVKIEPLCRERFCFSRQGGRNIGNRRTEGASATACPPTNHSSSTKNISNACVCGGRLPTAPPAGGWCKKTSNGTPVKNKEECPQSGALLKRKLFS